MDKATQTDGPFQPFGVPFEQLSIDQLRILQKCENRFLKDEILNQFMWDTIDGKIIPGKNVLIEVDFLNTVVEGEWSKNQTFDAEQIPKLQFVQEYFSNGYCMAHETIRGELIITYAEDFRSLILPEVLEIFYDASTPHDAEQIKELLNIQLDLKAKMQKTLDIVEPQRSKNENRYISQLERVGIWSRYKEDKPLLYIGMKALTFGFLNMATYMRRGRSYSAYIEKELSYKFNNIRAADDLGGFFRAQQRYIETALSTDAHVNGTRPMLQKLSRVACDLASLYEKIHQYESRAMQALALDTPSTIMGSDLISSEIKKMNSHQN